MNKLSIQQTMQQFEKFLFMQNKSKNTLTAYRKDLQLFQEFLSKSNEPIQSVYDITRDTIDEFQDMLLEKVERKEFTLNTAKRKFNAIKTWFNMLSETYGVPNITHMDTFGNRNTGNIDTDNLLPTYVAPEESIRLIEAVLQSKDSNAIRDLAMILLLLTMGLSRSDILGLQWQNVDLYESKIDLSAERNKPTVLSMTEVLKPHLLTHYATIMPSGYCPPDHVFTTNNGPLSESAFNAAISKRCRKAAILNNKNRIANSRDLRNTFIVLMLQKETPHEVIMHYTGLTDTHSFMRYQGLVSNHLRESSKVMENYYTASH